MIVCHVESCLLSWFILSRRAGFSIFSTEDECDVRASADDCDVRAKFQETQI